MQARLEHDSAVFSFREKVKYLETETRQQPKKELARICCSEGLSSNPSRSSFYQLENLLLLVAKCFLIFLVPSTYMIELF